MTQKHFVAIAAIFAGELAVYSIPTPSGPSLGALAVRGVILSQADYFLRENPRFNRGKFYLACGLTSEGFLP